MLLWGGLLASWAAAEPLQDLAAEQPMPGKVSLQAIQPVAGRVRIEHLSNRSEQSRTSGHVSISNLSAPPEGAATGGHVRLQTLSPVPVGEDASADVELPAWADAPAQFPPGAALELNPVPSPESNTARQIPLPNPSGAERLQPPVGGHSPFEHTQEPDLSELKFDARAVVRNALPRTQSAPPLPAEPDAKHEPAAGTADAIAGETISADQTISDDELARFGRFVALMARHAQVGNESLPSANESNAPAYQPSFRRLAEITTDIRTKSPRAPEADEPAAPRDPVTPEHVSQWFENKHAHAIVYGMSDPATWLQGTSAHYQWPFYHRPLYFENPRLERCGDTYGFYEPVVSSVHFCASTLLFPFRVLAIHPNTLVYATEDDCYP